MGNEMETAKSKDVLRAQSAHNGELSNVLQDLRAQQRRPKVTLRISRDTIFQDAMHHFKERGSEYSPLDIQFLSGGQPETVVNLGGPNREFFTLFLEEFKKTKLDMFEGNGGFLLPVNNQRAIQGDMFYYFGKILVLSNVYGGPGFPYFPAYVMSFLRQRECTHELSTFYIIDTNLKNYISAINQAENQEALDSVICNNEDRFLENCGWQRIDRITLSNRLYFIQTLLKWELIDKRRAALEQLREGLNVLHFLERVESLDDFEKLYKYRERNVTTAEFIKKKLAPKVEQLRPQNSEEENAKQYTIDCLKILADIEASYLFLFMTGLNDVPVSEFDLDVDFNRTDRNAELPRAITCIQRLLIPLGNQSKLQFYSSFNKALTLGRIGFDENDI